MRDGRSLRLVSTLLWLLGAMTTRAAEFYVAPNGSSSADGSIGSPWDLQSALYQHEPLQAGDTIWMRGGTYSGTFYSSLSGAPGNPIVLRQYPGERATIDGGNSNGMAILTVAGSYAWFWGFEVMSSDPTRTTTTAGSGPPGSDMPRGEGVLIDQGTSHPGLKFINMAIHDTRQGFSWWKEATDSDIYGCLVYYNGWEGPDDAHGHGIYSQNETGLKRAIDNFVFYQFGHGFHVYGSAAAYLDNYYLEGNTLFMNGELTSHNQRNVLIGGDGPAQNPQLVSNFLYYKTTSAPASALKLGYGDPCVPLTLTNNYVSNTTVLNCSSMTIAGNSFFGNTSGFTQSQYPDNTYYSSRPTGSKVFIRPNQYEAGRANITVYNWDLNDTMDLDLSAVLSTGSYYEIRNAQDYFGAPVASGTYTGAPVTVPVSGLIPANPVGWTMTEPTSAEFNAFVLSTTLGPGNFFDVPDSNIFHASIRTIAIDGITAGCGAGNFCPNDPVTRAQMAVFLLRSEHGASYACPPPTGDVFADVAASSFAAAWIEELASEGVSGGCGGGNYCPSATVTRAQMAVLLLKTRNGAGYAPPPATGIFSDVPTSSAFAPWIEELSREGVTAGCGGGRFCPTAAITRGQMATFLVRTFGLQ